MNEVNYADIGRQLAEPFPPEIVGFKPQSKFNDQGDATAVAFIDARAVADRLDEIVGWYNWNFDYEVLSGPTDKRQVVKGRLTILGIEKCDVGVATGGEGRADEFKGAVSDALKRCAILFGLGRYLYELKGMRCKGTGSNGKFYLSRDEIARLRNTLPKPRQVNKGTGEIASDDPRQVQFDRMAAEVARLTLSEAEKEAFMRALAAGKKYRDMNAEELKSIADGMARYKDHDQVNNLLQNESSFNALDRRQPVTAGAA